MLRISMSDNGVEVAVYNVSIKRQTAEHFAVQLQIIQSTERKKRNFTYSATSASEIYFLLVIMASRQLQHNTTFCPVIFSLPV